jgi:tRNA A-37 threonylcarbamoyl transferase component Bud32
MRDFLADEARFLLERNGLASFEAIWRLELPLVDDPNVDRGGWSAVCRLNLDGQRFFLKRQRNHRTRSLRAPLGEPTFTREFRNIQHCRTRNVPAVRAAFYAERKLPGHGRCAILMTYALEGWRNLGAALEDARADNDARHRLLSACGALARRLHNAGLIHCCFYPRHVFVRKAAPDYEACLIDLEKTRPLLFGARDRVKDLEQFLRHAPVLDAQDVRIWISRYLDCAPEDQEVTAWIERLRTRRRVKEKREAR